MALIERAIASAFVNDNLPIHLLRGQQGPHTLTFVLRLYQPTKANLAKALKLAGAVEAAIGARPVRIYSERGLIYVETPSPCPVVLAGSTLRGAGLAVPLGMTARRAIAGVDFSANPHLLLVGPTNAGKTTAARTLAYHLARQNPVRMARFVVTTFKPKDWRALGALTHTLAVVADPHEAQAMIIWLKALMLRRNRAGVETPHHFLFLDDLLNLLGCVAVATDLAEIASLGRAAGIHLVIGTQRLGELGAGGAAVTGNLRTRLVFGTADAQDAATFTGRGESGAERLGRYPGDALLVTEGRVQRLAVAAVADADLAALPQDPDQWRPWLHQQPAQPPEPHSDPAEHHAVTPDAAVGESAGDPAPPPAAVTSHLTKLPDAPPDAAGQALLRTLYQHLGSKRAVMKAAWGGVVTVDGNTPKTRRWLDNALGLIATNER
jgi:hypothetical protein